MKALKQNILSFSIRGRMLQNLRLLQGQACLRYFSLLLQLYVLPFGLWHVNHVQRKSPKNGRYPVLIFRADG